MIFYSLQSLQSFFFGTHHEIFLKEDSYTGIYPKPSFKKKKKTLIWTVLAIIWSPWMEINHMFLETLKVVNRGRIVSKAKLFMQ